MEIPVFSNIPEMRHGDARDNTDISSVSLLQPKIDYMDLDLIVFLFHQDASQKRSVIPITKNRQFRFAWACSLN